jgi:hypothetical protein
LHIFARVVFDSNLMRVVLLLLKKLELSLLQPKTFHKNQDGGNWHLIFELKLKTFDRSGSNPSTAFGHSDRKKRAVTGRHNFVTSIL